MTTPGGLDRESVWPSTRVSRATDGVVRQIPSTPIFHSPAQTTSSSPPSFLPYPLLPALALFILPLPFSPVPSPGDRSSAWGGELQLRTRGIIVTRSVCTGRHLRGRYTVHPTWKWLHQKTNQFIGRCHPYARKPASQAVHSRMLLTLHATRGIPHGALRTSCEQCLLGR